MPAGGIPYIQRVLLQELAAPVAVVEGRVGDDEIGFQVLVRVVQEAALRCSTSRCCCRCPDRQVHLRQSPGGLVAFLSVNGNLIGRVEREFLPLLLLVMVLVVFDELLALHKHAAAAATGSNTRPS